jgi:uncharacterized protein
MRRLEFLGKGWNFPIAPDAQNGSLRYQWGSDQVRQSIFLILETEPGERLMRPTFGCGLRRYLMKPNSAATRALIQRDVQASLTQWEPRIRLEEIRVDPGDDPALVLVSISYAHAHDGRKDNLVFPFYLE